MTYDVVRLFIAAPWRLVYDCLPPLGGFLECRISRAQALLNVKESGTRAVFICKLMRNASFAWLHKVEKIDT